MLPCRSLLQVQAYATRHHSDMAGDGDDDDDDDDVEILD